MNYDNSKILKYWNLSHKFNLEISDLYTTYTEISGIIK